MSERGEESASSRSQCGPRRDHQKKTGDRDEVSHRHILSVVQAPVPLVLVNPTGLSSVTPAGSAPNCLFLSCWKQDERAVKIALNGRARGIYLLMTGSTLPQCSRMQHGTAVVTYTDGRAAKLMLWSCSPGPMKRSAAC